MNAARTLACAIRVESAGREGQDCAAAIEIASGWFLVVADGAGGQAHGREASQYVIDAVKRMDTIDVDWANTLRAIDRDLCSQSSVGETTAVVAAVREGYVSGASVGDSGAWLVSTESMIDLTADQRRKPLLGSGIAQPASFGPVPLRARLLLGTDGLFHYLSSNRLALALQPSLETATTHLLDAVRLSNGNLRDDVAIILAQLSGTFA